MLTSRTLRLALLIVLGALAATASTVPPASAAAQRYAGPTGAGTACTSASPCSITQAIGGAMSGDGVIVYPGDYPLTSTLTDGRQIMIQGVAGRPRPRLLFSGAGQHGLRLDFGSTLRYVEVDQAAADKALFAAAGANVDQVIARASGVGEPTASIRSSTIRNSVVVASGTNGRALGTETGGDAITSTYRNVTAIATGSGGVPIEALALTAGQATIHLVNVIAYGGGPGALGLLARTDSSGAQATITVTHTSYQSADEIGGNTALVDGGGNPGGAPVFVSPAAGDYRQAAGSPTIGAGLDEPINGAFDVDGDPRTIGTTDIGADEFIVAPTPTTGAPTPTAPLTTPATSPTTPAFSGVKLVSSRLTFARRFIALKLSCPAGTIGRCSGRAKLTARHRRADSSTARRVFLGRAGFAIAAGRQATVRVRVPRAGRRLLSGVRRLSGKCINAADDGAGQSKTTVAAVTIRRRNR
jgi:hypothetical protein